MGTNNDDPQARAKAKSLDFAIKRLPENNHAEIENVSDDAFERTATDPLAAYKVNLSAKLGAKPILTNPNAARNTADLSMPPDPYDENLAGLRIAENYEILDKVGEGGMSAVYRARHLHLNREVAVKMLHPHLVSNRTTLERFSQEARAVSQIEHMNVVRLLDFGITDENRPYIVMDFLRGDSLSQIIKKRGSLPISVAIDIFLQICDALAYTHDKGIVHRDLKPSNVILLERHRKPSARRQRQRHPEEDGDEDNSDSIYIVKIVDFGIAKLQPHEDAGVAALTQTGDVFGSPLYMSPEQAKGEKLDNRADIYSMGCLMYEALTGVPPINGTNMLEILYRHMNEMPKSMNMLGKKVEIPRNLEAIVFKALAKDPKDRYQDMRSLEADLVKFNESSNGLLSSLPSIWSLYRSRRKRLNAREKIAVLVTIFAATALFFGMTGILFFYYKGTQDFSTAPQIAWLKPVRKSNIDTMYDQRSQLISYTMHTCAARISELRQQIHDGKTIEPTDADFEAIQSLTHNASELQARNQMENAKEVADKLVEYSTIVHGTGSYVTKQAMILRMLILYNSQEYRDCINQIVSLQKVSHDAIGTRVHLKAVLYSILGECYFHLKEYEAARSNLLEAMTTWEAVDREKEIYSPAYAEIRALAVSLFADTFANDDMWEESLKYYKMAYERWGKVEQPRADFNQALALFKESIAESQLTEDKKAEHLFKQATAILRQHPKDFLFYQTDIEMTQISAALNQKHGKWLLATEKYISAGLAKNRSNTNDGQ